MKASRQLSQWSSFTFDRHQISAEVALTRRAQGRLEGKLAALGFDTRQELVAEAWLQETISTAANEGERLNLQAMRSSIARRLTGTQQDSLATPRHIDGLLDIMDDAITNARAPLTHERLQGWQAALFPTGFSGMTAIRVGAYRDHAEPMQIVSGGIGGETIRYEAPLSAAVAAEMNCLLDWLKALQEQDAFVQAAIAHFWLEAIHPFEDGNGCVGRAVIDFMLARDAGEQSRLIRISQCLLENRNAYYEELNQAQRGSLDMTQWIAWFIA